MRARRAIGSAARAVVSLFGFVIALYAIAVFLLRERMFPPALADSFQARPWGILPHALLGGVALATGAVQFWRDLPFSRPAFHRALGAVYILAALGTGIAGLYMSFFAFGGAVTRLGFGLLAVALLGTTAMAYRKIRRRAIAGHREWMLRSFALIFAAVTLRLELPVLVSLCGGFAPAYAVVAWSSWVPNLIAAECYIAASRGAVRLT